jgi:hypothetical protein
VGKESNVKSKEKKGGLCCDYCADSKFPCVFMENKMKRDPKGKAKEELAKTGD